MILLLICLLAVAIYWPCRYGELVYDDVILNNHRAVQDGRWKHDWAWRRLTWISYALNVVWFGATAPPDGRAVKGWERQRALFGFHLPGVLLHGVNTALVYVIAAELRADLGLKAALVFAVHPMASMGVAYISGRASVLSAAFGFLAFWALLAGYAPLALAFLFCATWAKEDAVAFVGLFTVVGWFWGVAWWWIFLLPSALTLAMTWGWFLKLFRNNGVKGMTEAGFAGVMAFYHLTAFRETVLRLAGWALGFRFSADPKIESRGPRDPGLWIAVGLVATAFGLAAESPVAMTALLWVAASPLALYVIVPMPDAIAENRAYAAVGGLALLAALLPWWAILPLAAWFAVRTWQRASMFQTWDGFWHQVLADGGRTDRAGINIGTRLIEQGKNAEAREWFFKVLEENPALSIARANLALMDQREGKLDSALAHYEEALRRTPDYYQVWYMYGNLLDHLNRGEEAKAAYLECVKRNLWAPALNRLGLKAAVAGQPDEGLGYFTKALAREPMSEVYLHNCGVLLRVMGRLEEAAEYMKRLPREYKQTNEMLVVVENKTA